MRTLLTLILFILFPALLGAQSTAVTAYRLFRGSGVPAAGGCSNITAVGKVYVNYLPSGLAYTCMQTGLGSFGWVATGTGGGGGGPANTDALAEGSTNLYHTAARARAALSATSPLTYNSGTGAFGIQAASGGQAGYISAADWTAFNTKESALTFGAPLSRAVNAISCPTCSTTGHTHAAADTTSGVFGTARLGTGTANTTTYLRGDGSWQSPPTGAWDTFAVARTSTTALTVGANCSASAPCNFRVGGAVTAITGPRTITITGASNTGKVLVYVSSGGGIIAGTTTGLTVDCTGGCTAIAGVDYFPADSIPIYEWTANSTVGQWDSAGGTDRRAILASKVLTAGTGLSRTDNTGTGVTTLTVDPTVVGLKVSVPGAANTACTVGQWASDASYLYSCVAADTWRRVAHASW